LLCLEHRFIWTQGNCCPGFTEGSTKISLVGHYTASNKTHPTAAATKPQYVYQHNRHKWHFLSGRTSCEQSYSTIQVLTDLPPHPNHTQRSRDPHERTRDFFPRLRPRTATQGVISRKQIRWGNGLLLR